MIVFAWCFADQFDAVAKLLTSTSQVVGSILHWRQIFAPPVNWFGPRRFKNALLSQDISVFKYGQRFTEILIKK